MAREFTKTKTGKYPKEVFMITDYYTSDSPKSQTHNSDMTINLNYQASVSGGPIVGYFFDEKYADEYIKFKNEQINGIK